MSAIQRPAADEVPAIFGPYVAEVGDDDVVAFLRRQLEEATALLEGVSEEKADHRYAPGKWSLCEVVGHVVDAERIFAGRALRFARGDATPLPGFDSGAYVDVARGLHRPLDSVLAELRHLRSANVLFFESLDETALDRRGPAGSGQLTVRGLVFLTAGHAEHHLRILRERYL